MTTLQSEFWTLVENFVCNEADFKLYPVPDWEPEFFQVRGNVREFRGTGDKPAEFWTSCNLLNLKSVSDKNSELQ